jgi:hypothetical protein
MNNRSGTSSRAHDASWPTYLNLISSKFLNSRRFKRWLLVAQGKLATSHMLQEGNTMAMKTYMVDSCHKIYHIHDKIQCGSMSQHTS